MSGERRSAIVAHKSSPFSSFTHRSVVIEPRVVAFMPSSSFFAQFCMNTPNSAVVGLASVILSYCLACKGDNILLCSDLVVSHV